MFERAEPSDPKWYGNIGSHLSRYRFAAEYVKGKRVLDAGTGAGYGAYLLSMSGAESVQAIDIDELTVQRAQERFAAPVIRFFVDDCETLSHVQGPVDVICTFENIEHLRSPSKFLHAATKILKKDGILLCSTPDRLATQPFLNGRPANPFHVNEWYRKEFEDLLRESFDTVEMRAQVETFAQSARMRAIESLCREFHYNPAFRLPRFAARALGRKTNESTFEIIQGLAAGSDQDYPIVATQMALVVGPPFCHFALCRGPKAAG